MVKKLVPASLDTIKTPEIHQILFVRNVLTTASPAEITPPVMHATKLAATFCLQIRPAFHVDLAVFPAMKLLCNA